VINARSIATLGLGFGVVAVASLGLLYVQDTPKSVASIHFTSVYPAIYTLTSYPYFVISTNFSTAASETVYPFITISTGNPVVDINTQYPTIEVTRGS